MTLSQAKDLLGHPPSPRLRRPGKNITHTRIYAGLTSAQRHALHPSAIDSQQIAGV